MLEFISPCSEMALVNGLFKPDSLGIYSECTNTDTLLGQ